MRQYAVGDYAGALPHLGQVPAKAADGVAAALFLGLCHFQQHNWKQAEADFRRVAQAGDTPQLETAEYYLAQTMLELGDSAGARVHLAKTIALHGDYEEKAKAQQKELLKELQGRSRNLPG
jgi:tetratricopeptide (TPR) repeat protein